MMSLLLVEKYTIGLSNDRQLHVTTLILQCHVHVFIAEIDNRLLGTVLCTVSSLSHSGDPILQLFVCRVGSPGKLERVLLLTHLPQLTSEPVVLFIPRVENSETLGHHLQGRGREREGEGGREEMGIGTQDLFKPAQTLHRLPTSACMFQEPGS